MKIHKYIIGLVAALSLSSCHIAGYENNDYFVFDSYDELKNDLLSYAEDNQTLYFSNISLDNTYSIATTKYSYAGIVSKYGGLLNGFVEETELDMSSVDMTIQYSFLDEQMAKACITIFSVITEKNIDNLYIYESTITSDDQYYFDDDRIIETTIAYYICTYSNDEPENIIYYGGVQVGFLTRDIDNQIIIAKDFGENIINNITITTITK